MIITSDYGMITTSTVASYCRLLDASAFFRGISPLENGDSLGFAWEFHGEKWGFNDL